MSFLPRFCAQHDPTRPPASRSAPSNRGSTRFTFHYSVLPTCQSLSNVLPRHDSTCPEKMTFAIFLRTSTLVERASEQTSLAFVTMSTVYEPIFTPCVLNDPGPPLQSLHSAAVPPRRPARFC